MGDQCTMVVNKQHLAPRGTESNGERMPLELSFGDRVTWIGNRASQPPTIHVDDKELARSVRYIILSTRGMA